MALISAEGAKMEDALKENIRAFGDQFGETLSDMVMEGEFKFSTIRKMFLDMVAKTIMKFFFQKWINAGMKSMGLPGFANGGLASGLSVVGEKGPELVNFGSGASRVYSNSQSRQMVNKVAKNSQDLRPLSITLHVGEGVNAAAEQTVRNMIPYIGREVIGIVRDDQRRKGAA